MNGVFPVEDPMRLSSKVRKANATAARHPLASPPMAAGVKPTGVPQVPT